MADYPTGVPSFLEPKNFVKVDTASAISASDTTIPLVDASALPTGGGYLVADNESLEIIQYTGVSGNNLTGVTRGTDDSSPSSQPASTNLEMRWNAAYLNQSHTNIVAIAQDLYNCFSADLDDAASVGAVANNMEDRLDMIATQIKAIISGVDWKDSPTVTLNALDTEVSGKVAKAGDTMTGQLIMDNQVGIKLVDSGGTNGVTLNAPATLGGDYTILLPTAQSSGVRLLENDGSGNLAWRSLTNYITDAMINSSAAITLTKLATLTADRMVITNGSGYLSVAAITPGYMLISDANQIPSASGWAYSSGNLLTSAQGELRLADSGGTNYIGIEANASTTSYTIVFPAAQGAVDSVLKNDGAGNLTWAALGAGTGTVEPGLQYEIPFYNQAGTGNVVNGSTSIMTNATGQLIVADGAVGTPSISFVNDTDTGIYGGSGWIRFASGGSQTAYMGNGWFYNSDGAAAEPAYSFISDIDTGLFSAGANLIGFASNGNERMRLTTNDVEFYGNPGVSIIHATEATLDLRETTNTITIRIRATNAGSYIGTDTGHSLKIVTGNADRLTFGATGDATFATDVFLPNGDASGPSLSFTNDPNSGLYSNNATDSDAVIMASNGANIMEWRNYSPGFTHAKLFAGQFLAPNATDSFPAYSFTNDPDTGFYLANTSDVRLIAAGTTYLRVYNTGTPYVQTNATFRQPDGSVSSPAYSFTSYVDTGMFKGTSGGDYLGFSVGGTLQFYAQEGLVMSNGQIKNNAGSSSAPSYSFWGATNYGMYWNGGNDINIMVNGLVGISVRTDRLQIYKNTYPSGGGTLNLGDGTNFWGDISYKTLTDRGCLGYFDDGVEMQDGKVYDDLTALAMIQKHPTKKTIYGSPMLDYSTFPKVSYKKESVGEDGIEMTSMFSIFIGSFKQIKITADDHESRIKKLEKELKKLKDAA